MASAQASEKLSGKIAVGMYDHDPDSTDATAVEWVDMRDYAHFMAVCMASALTGNGVTAFTIVADANSDGSGGNVEVKSHAVGSAPDAVGDYLMLECTAEEIAELARSNSKALRYVSAKLTMHNAADENVVTYVRSGARFEHDALTADNVSA